MGCSSPRGYQRKFSEDECFDPMRIVALAGLAGSGKRRNLDLL
jgi:hypothetical protein